ncbi:hypothetical protein A2U01_0063679, partial [Trifolium medium]|nr:hypothetical protein [Trifolium medium]
QVEIATEKQKESVAEKEKVIGSEKEEMVVAEDSKKKKNKKRKTVGIKIDEGRSKRRHDKKSKKNDSSTETDDETLAQRLKQKTSEAYAKEMHQKFSKGKFPESSRNEPLEAQPI